MGVQSWDLGSGVSMQLHISALGRVYIGVNL